MVNCTILFNNYENGFFTAGQEVSGAVTLCNEKPRKIRALLLKVDGAADVRWTESMGTGDERTTRSYTAREDYIKTVSYLMNNGALEQELPAGTFNYNFCIRLPQNIPASFSSFTGNIVYKVSVCMDRRLKFNHNFEFPFKVFVHLDLNNEGPEISLPLRGLVTRRFFLGLSSKPLTLIAEIPYRGIVPGQALPISVKIINNSRVEVDRIFVELHRHYKFQVEHSISTRSEHNIMVKGVHDGVAVDTTSDVTFSMQIPPIDPTSVRLCKYIQITYELVIIAKVRGMHRSPDMAIPITIGSVPLAGRENYSPDLSAAGVPGISVENYVTEKKWK